MKTKILSIFSVVLIAAVMLTGCKGIPEINCNADDIKIYADTHDCQFSKEEYMNSKSYSVENDEFCISYIEFSDVVFADSYVDYEKDLYIDDLKCSHTKIVSGNKACYTFSSPENDQVIKVIQQGNKVVWGIGINQDVLDEHLQNLGIN